MSDFAYINVRMPCPTCGSEVSAFQSRYFHSNYSSRNQPTIDPDKVNNFRTHCTNCARMISFYRPSSIVPTFRAEPYSRSEVEALGFVLRTINL